MSPRRTRRLGVWLGGVEIAQLEQNRPYAIRCRYSDEALARWPASSPVISCSLPLGARPADAAAFCIGLLPEGQALEALAARARLPVNDTFGLLARYGRDVAGALVIAEDGPHEERFGVDAYDDAGLAAAVEGLDEQPLGADDESELSLAGLQDKLLLVRLDDGRWGRPLRGRPSTHILKRDDLRYPGLVDAEEACLRLAVRLGLTDVETELVTLSDHRCLIVSRFDRREGDDRVIARVHQEDLCQAMGIDPNGQRRRAKYQAAGGPSFADLATLLDRYAVDGPGELDRLVAVMTYTMLIGNADAHGKNLALLHDTAETIRLAPLYDTVPTVLWPKLRADGAMTIGGRKKLADVTLDDLVAEARTWTHPEDRARAAAIATAEQALAAAADGLVDTVPELSTLVTERARSLLAQAS
jgi:serine/threonine-protein kinase HipA